VTDQKSDDASICTLELYYTGGWKMVTDLQGTTNDHKYTLTDPAILSTKKGQYGSTDLGVEGMIMLLYKHTCNAISKYLPKPTIAMIQLSIPPIELQACIQMLKAIDNSTTYTWELRLTDPTRKKVAQTLRSVITSHH